MARRNRDRRSTAPQPTDWDSERTLAAAEQDEAEAELAATQPAASDEAPGGAAVVTCACGGHEFLLQAYLHVVDGQPQQEMIEVEGLTCPQCGREYEAIPVAGGRVLRGDFIGYADLSEGD